MKTIRRRRRSFQVLHDCTSDLWDSLPPSNLSEWPSYARWYMGCRRDASRLAPSTPLSRWRARWASFAPSYLAGTWCIPPPPHPTHCHAPLTLARRPPARWQKKAFNDRSGDIGRYLYKRTDGKMRLAEFGDDHPTTTDSLNAIHLASSQCYCDVPGYRQLVLNLY